MSEEIKLSLTAAKLIVGMKGKKFYTVPKAIMLTKMEESFELEMLSGKGEHGDAGDFIATDGKETWIIPAAEVAANYRPARSPKKVKPVTVVVE